MKKFLAFACFAACAFAQQVAGHWSLSMDTPHGPMNGSLDFEQEGSTITGKLELPIGSFHLKGGVDGAKVTFDIELPDGGGTLKFNGRMDGAKISGTTDPHGFKWEASHGMVGTLFQFRSHPVAFGLKPDSGPPVFFQVSPETQVVRVPPGEKDLSKASAAAVTDLAIGDRLLVTFVAGMTEARRIVVISPGEIASRNDAERADWQQRGISGIVTGKTGDAVTVELRSAEGARTVQVTVTPKTSIRRYAPDSVKFSDARPSSLGEIANGDQLRARGAKSEDGSRLAADDVVFGTFRTILGTISSVDRDTGEVRIQDLTTKAPLTIRLTADSRIKQLPEMQQMAGRMMQQHAPAAPGDIAQMLAGLPACNVEDLKVGAKLVVTATRGTSADTVTAILLVANIDGLIQMAQMQAGDKNLSPAEAISRMHHGMMDGPAGLTLPSIIQ